jgi:hypothetical protein
VLTGFSIFALLALIAMIDAVFLSDQGATSSFELQYAESLGVTIFDLAFFPFAVWQIAALQSGPRVEFGMLWRKLMSRPGLWLGNLVILTGLFFALNYAVMQVSMTLFSGLPLFGYLLVVLPYALGLVTGVAFQIVAYRALATPETVASTFS